MRYRQRKLQRMPERNYSRPGYYFIAIKCGHRDPGFGKIAHGEMILNHYGMIAGRCWRNIPGHFPDCAIDEFVVMPDHFHGIIELKKTARVGNRHACSLHSCRPYQRIPVIIGAFKSASARLIHQSGYPEFKWQKSYYDRILRFKELSCIRNYIRNNPSVYLNE